MLVPELRDIAQRMGVNGFRRLAKQDLIYKILDTQAVGTEDNKAKATKGIAGLTKLDQIILEKEGNRGCN